MCVSVLLFLSDLHAIEILFDIDFFQFHFFDELWFFNTGTVVNFSVVLIN